MTTVPFPQLFSPVAIGRREARNRIMRVATTCNLAAANRVSDRQLAFYGTVARGGAGSIVTESMRASPEMAGPTALLAYDRDSIPGFRKLADTVHGEGALLIGQLNHGGRQHLARRVPPQLIAPSEIACPRSGGVPHELTTEEVRTLIANYIVAAQNCIEATFDGVEVHCAQGHLMQQFLSPFSNRRTDDYGGSFENRLRFVRDIIEGIRAAIGREPALGIRLGVEEFSDGGLTVDDTIAAVNALSASGSLDYISLSQGNFNTIETHLPDRHFALTPFRANHARFKAETSGVLVVGNTRIQTPEQAEELLAEGDVDVIGLCRALIVDPEWPAKARAGRTSDIRRCIACNQCWGWLTEGEPMACATNPEAGREAMFGRLEPAPKPKHIVVVGGGPAGLETARVARLRGHRVTLFERGSSLGGRMTPVAGIRHYEETKHLNDFLVRQVKTGGTDIRLNTAATAEAIAAERPDAVVLATGATGYAPQIAGDGSVPIVSFDGPVRLDAAPDAHVVVMDEDGYYWGSAMAESAAQAGYRVTVVARVFEPFRELPVVSRIMTLRALDDYGAAIRANMEVHRVAKGSVVLRHYLSRREETLGDVAAIIWVGAQHANSELVAPCKEAGMTVHVIGDAAAPRRVANALLEAHRLARAL